MARVKMRVRVETLKRSRFRSRFSSRFRRPGFVVQVQVQMRAQFML